MFSDEKEDKAEKMETTPAADEKKGKVVHMCQLCHFYTEFYLMTFTMFILLVDQKDDKESIKMDEPAKLQNGDSSKDGVTGGASEEKKKAKTRFMFNIADGGFTGKKNDQINFLLVMCLFFCWFIYFFYLMVSCRVALTMAE